MDYCGNNWTNGAFFNKFFIIIDILPSMQHTEQLKKSGWHGGECPAELFIEYEERMREMTPGCWLRMCSIITEILSRTGNIRSDSDNQLSFFRHAASLCREKFASENFDVNSLAAQL